MPIQIYNTLTRSKEEFVPADPSRVTMYVCGPTVYSHPHIGNARPAVVFDVLARLLRSRYTLLYARNITDIDDKINAAAAEEGLDIGEIAARYSQVYHEDMQGLGVLDPDVEPRATDHVDGIIAMIHALLASDHAYEADGHVLFRVSAFTEYGHLSRRSQRELLAGARVEVAPYKESPGDFVLWKPSTANLPGWDSPWGRGRPGWHIECSVMAEQHLGNTIDIHGGGHDLIFPHHENEIAQSTCAHSGAPLARYWMHNGFVNVDHSKMSKSVGNILLVRDLLQQAPGEAVRLALLSAHYRQPLDWTSALLEESRRRLDRLYGALREAGDASAQDAEPDAGFVAALEDDLNTPRALARLFELARDINRQKDAAQRCALAAQLRASGALLGLVQRCAEDWFTAGAPEDEEIETLVAQRQAARAEKDFATADRIRDELARRGIVVEDRPGAARWRREPVT